MPPPKLSRNSIKSSPSSILLAVGLVAFVFSGITFAGTHCLRPYISKIGALENKVYYLQEQVNWLTEKQPNRDANANREGLGPLEIAYVLVNKPENPHSNLPNAYELEKLSDSGQMAGKYLFAQSEKVDLSQYLGKKVLITFRNVVGVIAAEQQLVEVESIIF